MLSSRLLARKCLHTNFKTATAFLQQPCRTYAYSRFPENGPGSSRTRDRPQRIPQSLHREPSADSKSSSDFEHEEKPSVNESDLWEASQRAPASDPVEGLTRLLMDNDVLVVTRYAEPIHFFISRLILT